MQPEDLSKECSRCLGCKPKPCAKACPLGVSPQDFIACAKEEKWELAAAQIAAKNPLPETCGLVCPDYFCQKACIRSKIDKPLSIPCLQAAIIKKGGLKALELPPAIGKKAAVIGGGPSGLGAVYELIKNGWHVSIFEKSNKLGGAVRLIPEYRLPKAVLDAEISRLVENDRVDIKYNHEITDFEALSREYDGVILALGEQEPRCLGVAGEEHCLPYATFLTSDLLSSLHPSINRQQVGSPLGRETPVKGSPASLLPSQLKANKLAKFTRVAVIGGGEVALDCALSAKRGGAKEVAMFVRRRREDMRIMAKDHLELNNENICVHALTSITAITKHEGLYNLQTIQNRINEEGRAEHIAQTEAELTGFDTVIMALGSYCPLKEEKEKWLTAGDMTGQCGTVVQAVASGMAAARRLIEQAQKEEQK